jgi:hypothetical protein
VNWLRHWIQYAIFERFKVISEENLMIAAIKQEARFYPAHGKAVFSRVEREMKQSDATTLGELLSGIDLF